MTFLDDLAEPDDLATDELDEGERERGARSAKTHDEKKGKCQCAFCISPECPKCGHSLGVHGPSGRCLYTARDGKACRCPQVRPSTESAENLK